MIRWLAIRFVYGILIATGIAAYPLASIIHDSIPSIFRGAVALVAVFFLETA